MFDDFECDTEMENVIWEDIDDDAIDSMKGEEDRVSNIFEEVKNEDVWIWKFDGFDFDAIDV